MHIIKWALGLSLCLGMFMAKGQAEKTNRVSHHIGIQANPLLKQLVNLGNSPSINNPFLLKYGLRFNESRKEILFGVGYSFNQETTRNDLKSDNSDLSLRLGYARKYPLGKKLELGFGLDLVFNSQNIQTVNVQAFNFGTGFDSTITTTKSNDIAYGLGPQATLRYYITDRVAIGTEATFYFLRSEDWQEVLEVNYAQSTGVPLTITSDLDRAESKGLDFQLQVPVALFLIIIL